MTAPKHPEPGAPARFLVVLDADSTLIENEAIELLAEEAGTLEHVARVTERAMRGEIDFERSLRDRVATLEGLPATVFETAGARIRPTTGVQRLIDGVHEHGSVVGVVSGGFHELLDPVAERLGLDRWRANRLEVVGGYLTGKLVGPVIDAAAKARALLEWASVEGIHPARTVAIGDGANDLLMMREAGVSVAFNAKPAVREQADLACGRNDLSDVLALLGLRG